MGSETELDELGPETGATMPAEIFDGFAGPIWEIAMQALDDEDRADRVVEATFSTFARSSGALKATSDPDTLLFSTARRLIFDLLSAEQASGRRDAPSAAASWKRWGSVVDGSQGARRPPHPALRARFVGTDAAAAIESTAPSHPLAIELNRPQPPHRGTGHHLGAETSDFPAGVARARTVPPVPSSPFATWDRPSPTGPSPDEVPDEVLRSWPPPELA